MLKKLVLIITMALAIAGQSHAATGDWRIHPYYVGGNMSKVIDTPSSVYYLVGNDLFRYDKATQASEGVNKRNSLHDVLVTNIYYNHNKDYVVVTYMNSNIDIIMSDGQVRNVPGIKDMVLTGLKGINDITFSQGKMFVATEFGFAAYDDENFSLKESHLFNKSIASATQVGNWVLISHDAQVFGAKATASRDNLDAYTPVAGITTEGDGLLVPTDKPKRFFVISNSGQGLCSYLIDDTADVPTARFDRRTNYARPTQFQPSPGGFISSFKTAKFYYLIDPDGLTAQQVTLTEPELISCAPGGDGTIWSLSANGLHKAGDENLSLPDGIGIAIAPFYLAYNKMKNEVLISSSSDNLFAEWGSGMGAVTRFFTYDGNRWTDITPSGLPGNGVSANWQPVYDPKDANTFVYPSRKYGVCKVTNGKLVTLYDATNSYYGSSYYKGACQFDSEGNLWVVYSSNNASSASANNVAVLPRAKYEQATCTKADWIPVSVPATKQKEFKGSSFSIGKGDVKVYNGGGYKTSFAFWRGTIGSTPEIAAYGSLQDQDGKSITWDNVFCMETDNNGLVWAGMDNGLVFFDPTQAFGDNFSVSRAMQLRNDGTGMAEVILEGEQVNCIAVDGNNHKWIGTNSAGLFELSPDGTKVLNQFTTDNSCLTSNTIYSVCCTNSNSVFATTPSGVVEYMSNASTSAANYDDVYVYPNPVRPDFTGLLTITNLMENSYITIKDGQGNVVRTSFAASGTATWDCCNDEGDRMPTGLYYVYASQQAHDENAAKVAEFLIIK